MPSRTFIASLRSRLTVRIAVLGAAHARDTRRWPTVRPVSATGLVVKETPSSRQLVEDERYANGADRPDDRHSFRQDAKGDMVATVNT